MRLRVDPNSGVPLGVQIARQVRLAIAAGRLAAGERLPTARDLAADLGVNFHTVRKAYQQLEVDGLLLVARGRGTSVAPGAQAMRAADLRALVRSHVERLAEDVAGVDVEPERLRELVDAELRRALRSGTGGGAGSGRGSE